VYLSTTVASFSAGAFSRFGPYPQTVTNPLASILFLSENGTPRRGFFSGNLIRETSVSSLKTL
jgi:hypothetical protein